MCKKLFLNILKNNHSFLRTLSLFSKLLQEVLLRVLDSLKKFQATVLIIVL